MNKGNKGFAVVVVIFVVLVVTATAGAAYVVFGKSDDKQAKTSNEEPNDREEQQTDDRDMIQNDNSYKLHGRLLAYNINRNGMYPEASAEGWQAFLVGTNQQEPLVDPFTSEPYKFTSTEPEFGEIEYRYPASCDDARIEFVEANTSRSYAFRLRFSDGVRCSHSL